MKHTNVSFHISLIFLIILASVSFAKEADPVAEKYQKAYNLILDKNWNEATKLLDDIIENFSDSKWVDDARFWKCYAYEKQEKALEKSFECYEDFINNFSGSKWADDAKSNMIRLARELRKAGKPEYEEQIQTLQESENDEIALAALYALQNRGDERALDAVLNLFNSTKNKNIKKKTIYVIGNFNSPKAKEKLMEIAESKNEVSIRKEAIFWLGQNKPSDDVIDLLKRVIEKDPEPELQKHALFSLSQIHDEKSTQYLVDIAKKHKDIDLRKKAIFWLGQEGKSPQTKKLLVDLALNSDEIAIQKEAIFALSQLSGKAGIPALMQIAKENRNEEMRAQAIFWLGQEGRSPEVLKALQDFALNDANFEVQKKAVFALAEYSDRQGLPTLLEIARNHKNPDLREDAIFWIGQKANTPEIIDALKDFALNDENIEVQKKAIFSLSEVRGGKGMPFLMDIAQKHKKSEVREQSIFWLGQKSRNPDVVKILEKIANSDTDPEVQEKAIFSLSQMSSDVGIPALINIAKNHKNASVRKKAIFWLGQSNDERAMKAIEEILYER